MTRMAPKPGAAYRPQSATPAATADGRDAQRPAPHRAAPAPAGSQSVQLTVRWRIGRSGSLVLALEPTGGLVRVAITLTPDGDRRGLARDVMSRGSAPGGDLSKAVPSAQALHYIGEGEIVRSADEWTIAARVSRRPDVDLHHDEFGESRAPADFAARLSVIEIESGERPLILTDLPSRIGLAGGTYALHESKAIAFCEALRGLPLSLPLSRSESEERQAR